MRGDFLEPEEMKVLQLCLTDVIQHQRWKDSCANVSSIGDIGRWIRAPRKVLQALVNTPSHPEDEDEKGVQTDLLSPL